MTNSIAKSWTASSRLQSSPTTNVVQPHSYHTFLHDDDEEEEEEEQEQEEEQEIGWFLQLLFSYGCFSMRPTGHVGEFDWWPWTPVHRCRRRVAHNFYHQCDRNVLRALVRTFSTRRVLLGGLGTLCTVACDVLVPLVLQRLVTAVAADSDRGPLTGWIVLFFVSRIVKVLVANYVVFCMETMTIRLVASLQSLLFAKAMRKRIQIHNANAHEDDSTGPMDLSQLYSCDLGNLAWMATNVHRGWVLPLQIGVVVYLLFSILDLAALVGLSAIGGSMWCSMWIQNHACNAYINLLRQRVVRMKAIQHVFGAIQVVKFNGWETKWLHHLQDVRSHELQFIARNLYVGAINVLMLWTTPMVISIGSFAVYSLWLQQPLTVSKVFTSMVLFNMLQDPLRELVGLAQECVQASMSIRRIQQFLEEPEYDPDSVERPAATCPVDRIAKKDTDAIRIDNGIFDWTRHNNTTRALLQQVHLQVKRGDFVVVHGPVGSGKSSLCCAMLGEMHKLQGRVVVRGSVAYHSQQPWIQNMSIRDNILFGLPFDKQKYNRVLDACGLLADLNQFPAGDATEIGPNGLNLSSGQEARVSLARACYSDADMLILDSPLASVDTIVQKEIFTKCLCGLLSEKTVVLVTSNEEVIGSKVVNYRIRLEDGALHCERLQAKSRVEFANQLEAESNQEAAQEAFLPKCGVSGLDPVDANVWVKEEQEEDEEVREVGWEVVLEYCKAIGGVKVIIWLVLIHAAWQACQIGSDLWLSHWTSSCNTTSQPLRERIELAQTKRNLLIYALLGCGAALTVLMRVLTICWASFCAAKSLFEQMTSALLHAPLRFFDAHPMNQIVTRYSEDMSMVDFALPFASAWLMVTVVVTICQLATVLYLMRLVGLLLIPLVWMYVQLAKSSLRAFRDASSLSTTSTLPLQSHGCQCEQGLVVMRAFGTAFVQCAIREHHQKINESARVLLSKMMISQWILVRMQFLGCGLVLFVVSALVLLRDRLLLGMVGIGFMYALSVDTSLANLFRAWSALEVAMVSAARVLEYARIEPEGARNPCRLDPVNIHWPSQGAITFDNVVSNNKPGGTTVLHGVSFAVKPCEKIGIVGRTGAGKSSLAMALFRINELVSGRILVDNVDISYLNLQTLRAHLSIIPQSPVLFKGPLRGNLDPFDEFDDDALWRALSQVEMKHKICGLENKLLFELSENGETFSVGERQLLCMARALLGEAKVVVVIDDEATASMDRATQAKRQQMIRREFTNATVLTIAHRLSAVLDSDRIVVMDAGRVVDFDSPKTLLSTRGGWLYQMAAEDGVL